MGLRVRAAAPAVLAAWMLGACGGSGSNGGGNNPGGGNGGTTQNPCATASVEPASEVAAPPTEGALRRKTGRLDRDPRWRVLDALWTHRQNVARAGQAATTEATGRNSVDVGQIAVIQDEGDLIARPNELDLRSVGLRFTRNSSGGYDVARANATFRSALGTRLTLGDDDSRQVNVPFTFQFYGTGQTVAFVNSDGNITFGEEDRSSSDRDVGRLLTGPPRVAPFLADLDPTAGGRVYANAAADQYTVTWCGVRGFDSTRTATLQVTLLPDGAIEMKFGDAITLTDAVVGLSPGGTGVFTTLNLSDNGPLGGGAGALGERFAATAELDAVGVARKFYRTHSDDFDQLVIWTDSPLVQDAFAYETTVANEIRGLGIGLYDASRDFGSAGRLRSFVVMDFIGKYPESPQTRFLGENNTVSVLGQEVGHRWLAFLDFRDHTGSRSSALLGRDDAHWSFFLDSDASVMEGNDIEDLGGGSFRTVAAVQRYSQLDQYAMGLLDESDVRSFFYVENPINVSPSRDREDAPRIGVTFNGTRRDVFIDDVIAANGRRNPSSAQSPRLLRQAFLLIVSSGRSPDAAQIDKVDRIRREWETFFFDATDRRMRAQTTIQ